MIVLSQVPNDIKCYILIFIMKSIKPSKSTELELLLAAAENNREAIDKLVKLYEKTPVLHGKYRAILSGSSSKQFPSIVYPELAYYHYKNREYGLALKYLKLIEESGDHRFKLDIDRLSRGLPLKAGCELLERNKPQYGSSQQ